MTEDMQPCPEIERLAIEHTEKCDYCKRYAIYMINKLNRQESENKDLK